MARNSAATDVGVGQASVTTKIKLTIQASRKCFQYGALPCLLLPLLVWMILVRPVDVDIIKIHVVSSFVSHDTHRKWRMRDERGVRKIIAVSAPDGKQVEYFTPAEINRILISRTSPLTVLKLVLLGSLIASIIGYAFVWRKFGKVGLLQQTNKRIRGANSIIDSKDLNSRVLKNGHSDYTFADVALPASAPAQGIAALGAQGVGKSLTLHDLMQQVFAKKKKCVIYDPTGEFYRAYFRPGKDLFFNPAYIGSVPWSLFEEIKYSYNTNTLAQAFLPPKAASGQGANAFFEDAARALFSVILLRLAQRGAENTRDIATAFLEMPAEEMEILIKQSVASSAVGGDAKGQRQGVVSSIAIYLDGIAAVNPGTWSISKFLNDPGDARLFILGSKDTEAMFTPLHRLILSVAWSAIASKQEIVYEDKYWFFLDELPKLGDIKIDEKLAEDRKWGVCIVAGMQNDSQLVTTLGKDRAETVMNGFNTLLQLRLNDTEAKDRAARRMDKLEMATVSQNQALAVVEQRDGAGIVINEQEKWLIMPAEIGQLDNCTGYLKLSGSYPVATVNYQHWLPKKPGQPCRADKFKKIHDLPPLDPRFVVSRPTLPGGESAFDALKKEAENERKTAAEQKKQAGMMVANVPTANAIDMAAGATTGSTAGINEVKKTTREFDLDL